MSKEKKVKVKIAGCTDAGIRRSLNEDSIGIDEGFGIAVLADGMGGHRSGEIASGMAVESVLEALRNLLNPDTSEWTTGSQLLQQIREALSHSNAEIYTAALTQQQHKGMGTTVVAALIRDGILYAGHVGDSRLYLYRNGGLERLTKDHSLLQDLIDRGTLTKQQGRTANVGHVLTRALGLNVRVDVDTVQHELQANDLCLLCSDGLYEMVDGWRIEEILKERGDDLAATARTLVDTANRNGGKDNISVILMAVSMLPEPP